MNRQVPRWAVSLADLTMVLLAFFVILHAAGPRVASGAVRSAFGSRSGSATLIDEQSDRLFEGGEARLTPEARRRLASAVRGASGPLVVESFGRGAASRRLDGWELAAARTAAIAHALNQAGVAEDMISILMPESGNEPAAKGHRILVRRAG